MRRANPDLGSLQPPFTEEPPSSFRDLRDLRGFIVHKVSRDGSGEDLRGEVRRRIGDAAAENRVGFRQELADSAFILEGVNRRTAVLRAACTASPWIDLHVTASPIRAQIAPEIDPAKEPFRRRCGTLPLPTLPLPSPACGEG